VFHYSGNSFWRTIEEWVLDGHLSGYNVQTGSHSTVGHRILANRALPNFRLLLRNKGIPNPNFLETKNFSGSIAQHHNDNEKLQNTPTAASPIEICPFVVLPNQKSQYRSEIDKPLKAIRV
jgi:hypothetical protein